jgi:hypothetical protein
VGLGIVRRGRSLSTLPPAGAYVVTQTSISNLVAAESRRERIAELLNWRAFLRASRGLRVWIVKIDLNPSRQSIGMVAFLAGSVAAGNLDWHVTSLMKFR